MNTPQLDVTQLQRRDPHAWTVLLNSQEGMHKVVVTAVSAQPLLHKPLSSDRHQLVRYTLTLAHHSDPITFIGKRTNKVEAWFYQELARELPFLAPTCWFAQVTDEQEGWVILDDVPVHYAPQDWTANDIDAIIGRLTQLHLAFAGREDALRRTHPLPHFIGRQQKTYTWHELRQKHAVYFDEGPASVISEHAINQSGWLAPVFLRAANGLTVIRSLGGWPGILGESHLAAAADLLDDPVPMLETLARLPVTLLHGDPHNYHWHLTLFEEQRLLDWHKVAVGPGVYDLINFVEQLDLIYLNDGQSHVYTRQEMPVTQETVIDSYILTMSQKLGTQFNARLVRQAIPAARCLHVLTHWFPHFADWFSQMPSKYTWQKVNRMTDEQLVGTIFQPIIGFRPYLSAVFRRFLQAYRTL